MKASTLLKKALKEFSVEYRSGICVAVSQARQKITKNNTYEKQETRFKAETRITQRIMGAIAPYTYASQWLAAQILPPGHDFFKRANWIKEQDPKAIQAWRRAWMLKLIDEFEKEGD
jgi:hypothetical protein